MIFLCDIDGTLGYPDHRQHLVEPRCACQEGAILAGCSRCRGTGIDRSKADWDAFYNPELVIQDPPNPDAQRVVPGLARKLGHRFFFHTGRPEKLREATHAWLRHHFGVVARSGRFAPPAEQHLPHLVMRTDGDRRPSVVYKRELPHELSQCGELLMFADDDLRNTELYRHYGVFLHAPDCWKIFVP